MMVCGVRADRERQAVAIHNRHDFQTFSTLGRANIRAAALGHSEDCVDEAFFFIQRTSVAKFVGDIRQSTKAKSETGDAPFCSSDNSGAACATAPRCSKSTTPLPELAVSEPVCDRGDRQGCSPRENDPGYVPTPYRQAELSPLYSGPTLFRNFEIGSSLFAWMSLFKASPAAEQKSALTHQ